MVMPLRHGDISCAFRISETDEGRLLVRWSKSEDGTTWLEEVSVVERTDLVDCFNQRLLSVYR